MTTYGAYNAGLPCKNPSCKSYGKPHPNCRCWGDHAEGGDAAFCSDNRPHNQECEYFAKGGAPTAGFSQPPPTGAAGSGDEVPPEDLPEPSLSGQEVPPEDLPEAPVQEPQSGDEVPKDDLPSASDKYNRPGQGILAETEALGRGLLGPVATYGERYLTGLGVPGLTPEDQQGRREAFPIADKVMEGLGNIGGVMGGIGVPGAIAQTSKIATNSKIIQAAIQGGLLQGSDEVSNALLGQGDQENPVAHAMARMGIAGLLTGAWGIGGKLAEAGIGKTVTEIESMASPEYFEKLSSKIVRYIVDGVASVASHKMGGDSVSTGLLVDKVLGKQVEKLIGRPIGKTAQKYMVPAVLKVLESGDGAGLGDVVRHIDRVAAGAQAVNSSVERLFSVGSQKAFDAAAGNEKNREKVLDWIKGGGATGDIQQKIYDDNEAAPVAGYAHGGDVQPEPTPTSGLERHYPEQSMIMHAALGRVSNYLMGLKPPDHHPRLAFDEKPDMREQKKTYGRAVDIAASPLSVMDKIQKGTVEAEDIKHLNSMYPEVTSLLQKKVTERISKAQLKGEKPPYKVRQGLSMLLGTPLSGEMTPENIQAAQAVFAAKAPEGQPPAAAKDKKSAASLTKSDASFLTTGQALAKRQQRVS